MSAIGTFPEIPIFDLRFEAQDIEAAADTLRSGWLTLGPRTQELETAFAEHIGCAHAVAVSSCTAALHLSYLAAGVGPGDEVIVPAFTMVATASAVAYCGATPVFADVLGPQDLSLDPAEVEARIGPRTKAVCVVHYAGYPGRVAELRELCERRGVALIEDAAHAPSSSVDGKKLGTWGLAGTFSFFSNKVLAAGEGGMLTTDDDDAAAVARSLRSQAMTSGTWARHTGATTTYDVVGLGFNYRIDEVRSAILLSRLARLESDVERRRELARSYRRELGRIDGLLLPYTDDQVDRSSCDMMTVIVEEPGRRDRVREHLRTESGIQTSVHFPAVHTVSAFRKPAGEQPSLPRTEAASDSVLTLPMFPHLTNEQQERVVLALEEALRA